MRLYKIWLFNDVFNSQDRDSGKEKQDLSHSVSENTTLRKLVLHYRKLVPYCPFDYETGFMLLNDGPSDYMTAVLHGVAASATIEDLKVGGKLAEGHVWLPWLQHYCIVYHKLVTCSLPHLYLQDL